MNASTTSFEFTCLGKRINEIVSAIFHSVIFNRCCGKFNYNYDNSYSIGTLGFEEVICDFIDFTYIRVSSLELGKKINDHIKDFVDELRRIDTTSSPSSYPPNQVIPIFRRPSSLWNVTEQLQLPTTQDQRRRSHQTSPTQRKQRQALYASTTGSISLEFLLKNKSRTFTAFNDPLIWEVWTLKFNCLKG